MYVDAHREVGALVVAHLYEAYVSIRQHTSAYVSILENTQRIRYFFFQIDIYFFHFLKLFFLFFTATFSEYTVPALRC
jgi:hypothetical protein